ncbi:hypothetical protein PIB30_008597 [Stylosanthes scabra]|uniref:Uncharacterized protein n=1 Tax=Stylosanthes scabra TaxID=79078 RepID=A0ABU6R626_9FABA|nr:hypothetical protein [Stylosanthes scabra]
MLGPEEQQPVIPPLLGVGSDRCSVKPASRFALHSRNKEAQAFAQTAKPNSQLGAGRPAKSNLKPRLESHSTCSITFVAPTWVTSWRYPTRRTVHTEKHI